MSAALFIFKNTVEKGDLDQLLELKQRLEGAGELFEYIRGLFTFDLTQLQMKKDLLETTIEE